LFVKYFLIPHKAKEDVMFSWSNEISGYVFSVTSHAPYVAVILYCWSDKYIMTLEYLDRNAGLKVEFIAHSISMLMAIVMLTSGLVLFHRMDYILKI
jgi:hypothetical protein